MSTSATISKKEKVVKQAAIHRASVVAASTRDASRAIVSPSAFSAISKSVIELQIMALQSQLILLEELSTMSDQDKMETLFAVMDKNRDGSLSVVELADGLRKIRGGDVNFEESLALAVARITQFDKDGNAKLDFEEFQTMAKTVCEAMGTSFHELSEMFIFSVLFSNAGNDEVEELVATMADEDVTLALKEETTLAKVENDERMKALFFMFDLDGDGSVSFPEVATGLYKITHDLDTTAQMSVAAILCFDDDNNSTLDYTEFTRFILQLIDASGTTFDEAVLNMTKAAAEEETDMTTKQIMESIRAMAKAE